MKRHTFLRFSRTELGLWGGSVALILLLFGLFDGSGWLTLAASLIGATSLILNAKGHPLGQALMLVFSGLYGYISYTFAYYGEMLTYLGMTAPMAAVALISWLRHPYKGNRAEVAVGRLRRGETLWMLLLSLAVTGLFYFVLAYFDTANLLLSTLSVTTSFIAAYLTFRRSPWFAFAYAANDIVLIGLWVLASRENAAYISVTVCFAVFLVNDLYGFIRWRHRQNRQQG